MPQMHILKIYPNFLAQSPTSEPNLTVIEHHYDVINLPDVQVRGRSYLNQRYAPAMEFPFENQEADTITINFVAEIPTPRPNLTPIAGDYHGNKNVVAQTPTAEPMLTSIEQHDDVNTKFLSQTPTPEPKLTSNEHHADVNTTLLSQAPTPAPNLTCKYCGGMDTSSDVQN